MFATRISMMVHLTPTLEESTRLRYITPMTKASPQSSSIGSCQVRNAKTGQLVTVRGMGALKGHLTLQKGVDLTKPVASQALKGRVAASAKR